MYLEVLGFERRRLRTSVRFWADLHGCGGLTGFPKLRFRLQIFRAGLADVGAS